MKIISRLLLSGVLFLFLQTALTKAEETSVDRESRYSEAILAYHRKKLPESLKLLEEILAADPQMKKAHELKALIYKSSGKLPEAYEAYAKLLQVAQKAGVPKKERAPYQFEMGLIRFQQKKFPEARPLFEAALSEDFNKTVALYFLGMMDFQEKRYSKARDRLSIVAQSNIADLKAPAHLYLGQISANDSDLRGALSNLVVARNLAQDSARDRAPASVNPILNSANEALRFYDQGGYWGSVGLVTAYDTNVLLNPTATVSATGASGNASLKETLQFGIGYSSSPVQRTQWIPSYRGTINYNLNQSTKTGQFSTHNLGLQIARDPYDRVSFGLKLESFMIFRTAADGTDSAGKFAPYSFFGSAGPYFRVETSKHSFVGMEFFGQPQVFFQDSETDDRYKNTGFRGQFRTYYRRERPGKGWNPGAALQLELNLPSTGTEFKSKGATLELSNYFTLSKTTQLAGVGQVGAFIYDSRPDGYRGDYFFSLMTSGQYLMTQHFLLTASLQYTNNLSNVEDTYQYNRIVGSLGAIYAF